MANAIEYYRVLQNIATPQLKSVTTTPKSVTNTPKKSVTTTLSKVPLPDLFVFIKEALDAYKTSLMFTLTISDTERQRRKTVLLALMSQLP